MWSKEEKRVLRKFSNGKLSEEELKNIISEWSDELINPKTRERTLDIYKKQALHMLGLDKKDEFIPPPKE